MAVTDEQHRAGESQMRILFVGEEGDSVCAYYRCHLPAQGLRALGYPVDVCHILFEHDDGKLYGLHKRLGVLPAPDVIVCRRMNGIDDQIMESAPLFERARSCGQRIYVDVDDDLWHLPAHNPAYRSTHDKELAVLETDMRAATGVICSTPALAETVRQYTGAETFVCRNGIDAKTWPARTVTEHRPLRLAWMGHTAFRGRDLVAQTWEGSSDIRAEAERRGL